MRVYMWFFNLRVLRGLRRGVGVGEVVGGWRSFSGPVAGVPGTCFYKDRFTCDKAQQMTC